MNRLAALLATVLMTATLLASPARADVGIGTPQVCDVTELVALQDTLNATNESLRLHKLYVRELETKVWEQRTRAELWRDQAMRRAHKIARLRGHLAAARAAAR